MKRKPGKAAGIRDRIVELRRVKASELVPSSRNWRRHPQGQQDALRGVLAKVGYAGALIARELPDGRLELIDGQLRAETTPDQAVPVLVLDVSEEEAKYLLATLDPVGALAETDEEALEALFLDKELEGMVRESPAVQEMLAGLSAYPGTAPAGPQEEVSDLVDMIEGETEWNPDPVDYRERVSKQVMNRIQEIPEERLRDAHCVILPREGRHEAIVIVDPDLHDIVAELKRRHDQGETRPLDALFDSIWEVKK